MPLKQETNIETNYIFQCRHKATCSQAWRSLSINTSFVCSCYM